MLMFYYFFQDSHADAEGCSAQYIVTVISTNARSTIKSLVLKKSGNPIPSWWPAKCRKSRKFVVVSLLQLERALCQKSIVEPEQRESRRSVNFFAKAASPIASPDHSLRKRRLRFALLLPLS